MTDCQKIRQMLDAFVDNELDEQAQQLVEAHLQQCPICRDEVAIITKLHHWAKEAMPEPSNDYLEKLTEQVWFKIRKQERVRAKARFFWIPRLAPILAGTLTLILVAVIGIKFLTMTSRIRSSPKSDRLRVDLTSPKKMKEPSVKPPIAEALKATKELTDKLEKGKVDILKTPVARAEESELKGLSQIKTKQTEKTKGIDLAEKETAGARETKPILSEAKSIPPQEGDTKMLAIASTEKPETIVISELTELAPLSERTTLVEKEKTIQWQSQYRVKPIAIPQPKYPKQALRQKLSGRVVVEALVDTVGRIVDAKVLKSSGYGTLDTAALKAAKKSRFEPVKQNDKKVRVWITIPFEFNPPKN